MHLVSRISSALATIALLLWGFSGCQKNPNQSPPDTLPSAINYRPVLQDEFFLILDLAVKKGQVTLSNQEEILNWPPFLETKQLFEQRKIQEGGHADVVIAGRSDVPFGEVRALIDDFAALDIHQFHFQVQPRQVENGEDKPPLALLTERFHPGRLDALQSAASTQRLLQDSTTTDTSIPQTYWLLNESQYAIEQDTFPLNSLGGHLQRKRKKEEDLAILVCIPESTQHQYFIKAIDQIRMSGLRNYTLLSQEEHGKLFPASAP